MRTAACEVPERVGPYRIVGRLGRGGMGEVFLAHDVRLDRQVAVKRVRGTDFLLQRRERLQREARLAARLNHPAIVQVHDFLTEGDADYAVLEYVEGPTLHRLLQDGPLSLHRALTLACEIASGLVEAHRLGIVHRDLKSENVLLTPLGRAKIADFGLAKRFDEDDGLTASNALVGTYRAMSPEQARGEPLDHRSDLFSFGVLLYEALTGRSPFLAENGLATLQRILTVHPPPLAEVVPGTPAALSALVERLLEKEPRLRPASTRDVLRDLEQITRGLGDGDRESLSGETLREMGVDRLALQSTLPPGAEPGRAPASAPSRFRTWQGVRRASPFLAAAALGALGAWLAQSRPPAEPLYVAVMPPEIAAHPGDAEQLGLLASGVRTALLRGLVSLEGISPKAFEEIDEIAGPPTAVARAISADEVLTSRLECQREICRMSLSRLRGSDGGVLRVEAFDLPIDDASLLVNVVGSQVRRGYAGHAVRAGSPDVEASGADVQAFLELRRRFEARSEPSTDGLLAGLAEIRKSSPRFVDAYLLEAEVSYFRYHLARETRDLEHAADLLGQARELAPGDPQPLFLLIDLALADNQTGKAGELVAELERLAPGDARVLDRQARILTAQGRTGEAIALLERSLRLRPSWKRLYSLAHLEYRHGKAAEARRELARLLEIAPGNSYGLSLLAELELMSGELDEAIRLYRELTGRSPTPNRLSNLGLAYLLRGRYAEAAATFREVTASAPQNPHYLLNLADACHLMGREDEARRHYGRVVELIESDPGAVGPDFLSTKAQALAHLGRSREALAATREADRLAPDDANLAFGNAVVHAVVGERQSALLSAETALRLGMQPRWFSFPWFAGLAPEIRELTRQGGSPALKMTGARPKAADRSRSSDRP